MAESGRIPVPLRLCRGCRQFVRIDGRADCIHCGADLDAGDAAHDAALAELHRAKEALKAALAERGIAAPKGL
ncbi:MAG: hypothetical protein QOD42_3202 [Sphingomonadales bacterium]|jgi:hypothetical protein|nr:hypothetical protein [Sphingomonadales bacterium]